MAYPTLKDVASACGVSTATVSMALSGKGSISPEMVGKISAVAHELKYTPRSARKQNGPGFKNVSIIQWEEAPFLWHFSQPFVLSLEKVLIREGYRPIIIHKLPEMDDQTLIKEIKTAKVGAVFAIHYVNSELFDQFEAEGIPVILINNNDFQDKYWSVLTDDIQGALEATEKLIESGHKQIAYAEYSRFFQQVVLDRFHGFKLALDRNNIIFRDEYRIAVNLDDTGGLRERLSDLMRSRNPPTGIFVHDDYFAALIHNALSNMGYRIPEDISIVAPGDVLDYAEPFFPRISTMQIDRQLMTRMAWDLLLSRIDNKPGRVKVLKTKMHYVDRGSCAPPPDRRNT